MANAIWLDENTRFNYEGRAFAMGMHDDKSARRVWLCARQIGKTQGGTGEAVSLPIVHPGSRVLYVAPLEDQVRKYSYDKVGPTIDSSPIIRSQIQTPDNVYEKSFSRGGKLYMKWAKNSADSIRGISSIHFIQYDEIQDLDLDSIEPVIDQVTFQVVGSRRLLTGTPKSFANDAHKAWVASDQREFMIACRHHSPVKHINLGIRNIGLSGPVCHHCGNALDVSDGMWVSTRPGMRTAGFHVSQLHAKISHFNQDKWDELLHKFESYPEDRFLNEVMGRSADSATQPITQSMIAATCNPNLPMNPSYPAGLRVAPCYAGIDWGHGEAATAIAICQLVNSRVRYLYFNKWEGAQCQPDVCIPEILSVLKRFEVVKVHCDYGGGFGLNSMLAQSYGKKRVTTNMWSGPGSRETSWSTKHGEVPRLMANKSIAFSIWINNLRRRSLELPSYESINPMFTEDMENVRQEVRKDGSIIYVKSGNEDTLQACVYARIIALMDQEFDPFS